MGIILDNRATDKWKSLAHNKFRKMLYAKSPKAFFVTCS